MNDSLEDGGGPHGRLRCLCLTGQVVAVLESTVHDVQDRREECGLLGGVLTGSDVAVATVVNRLQNISRLSGSFAVSIDEFLRSKEAIEASGLLPLAIFHSHPDGSTRPSLRDTKLPWITSLLSLIIAKGSGKLLMECYADVEGKHMSIRIEQHAVPL